MRRAALQLLPDSVPEPDRASLIGNLDEQLRAWEWALLEDGTAGDLLPPLIATYLEWRREMGPTTGEPGRCSR